MVTGTQNILNWFDRTGFAYWTIFKNSANTASGNPVMRSKLQTDITHSQALEDLRDALKIINRGTYHIVANDKDNLSGKGSFREDFEITDADRLPNIGSVQPVMQAVPQQDIDKMIKDALDKYKTETELTEMRKKVAELTRENKSLIGSVNEPMNRLIKIAEPFLPHLLGQVTAKVAGVPAESSMQNQHYQDTPPAEAIAGELVLTDEENLRLAAVVDNLHEICGPAWLTNLELLAEKLAAKPELLSMLNYL